MKFPKLNPNTRASSVISAPSGLFDNGNFSANPTPLDVVIDSALRGPTRSASSETPTAAEARAVMDKVIIHVRQNVSGRRTYTYEDYAHVINFNTMIAWIAKSLTVFKYRLEHWNVITTGFFPTKFGCNTIAEVESALIQVKGLFGNGIYLPNFNFWYFDKLVGVYPKVLGKRYDETNFYVNCAYLRYGNTEGKFVTTADGNATVDSWLEEIRKALAAMNDNALQLRADLVSVFPGSCLYWDKLSPYGKLSRDELRVTLSNIQLAYPSVTKSDNPEWDVAQKAWYNTNIVGDEIRQVIVHDDYTATPQEIQSVRFGVNKATTGGKLIASGIFFRYYGNLYGYKGSQIYQYIDVNGINVDDNIVANGQTVLADAIYAIANGFYPLLPISTTESLVNKSSELEVKFIPDGLAAVDMNSEMAYQYITSYGASLDALPYGTDEVTQLVLSKIRKPTDNSKHGDKTDKKSPQN